MNTAQRYKNKYKKLFIVIFSLSILTISYTLLATRAVHAQEVLRTITISPPTISQSLKPGERAEGVLKVINDGSETINFSVSTQDFIVDNKGGAPNLLAPNTLSKKYSATAWIAIYPNSFTVAPHQKQIVNYYIQVPSDARPGGHYAAVVYQPANVLGVKGSAGTGVNTYIGSLFSIDVAGPIHEEAKVVTFNGGGFYEYGPVKILTEIQNLGDLHIKPLGTITFYDIFHRELMTIPLDEHNVFPGAIRQFNNVFGQQWMLGPFTAKLSAHYGRNNNLPLMATVTFWVFPWKVTIVLLLLIAAAVLGYLVWKKRQEEADHDDSEGHKETPAPNSPKEDAPKE